MLGPLLLVVYHLIAFGAWFLPEARRRAIKARWALRFSSMTDGGLDDDFAETAFQLIREQPDLLDSVERRIRGNGIFALRQRLSAVTIRGALASGANSLYSA